MSGTPTAIRVLHVDDDRDLGELVAAALEREDDRFDVLTATNPDDALALLTDERVDCVVSDYDMPGMTGIEFLETVRERDLDLPFVLYTGKGSEEVASEAISAGVTDYLQKGTGTDQYALLANRIDNAVSAARSRSALEERNRRLETLISNLPGVVYRCRNEPPWPMEFVAGECEELIGYTAAELERGAVVWGEEVLHPEDRDRMWETVQSALDAGDPFEVSYRIRTADGEVRWMWERGRAIGEDGARIEGFITDVTERRERAQTLERYRSMVDAMPDAACIYDADGRFAIANDYLADFFGTSPEGLEGRESALVAEIRAGAGPDEDPFGELVTGDREEFQGEVETSFPAHGEAVVAYRLARLEIDGEFDGVVGVARVVTERKRREDALSALTEATRQFMDAPDRETVADHAVETAVAVLDKEASGLWFVDDDGSALRPVAATDAAAALIGDLPTYTGGESLTWDAFRSGEVTVCDDLQTEPDRYNPETPLGSEIILPLGEYGVMAVGATELAAFDEVDVSLARILANTVEAALDRAAREQESREHRRELERQNERLDEFAGIVSHDLRNPLQIATARAEFLAEEVDSEHLTAVQRAHDRMEALIDDLLTLGREGKTVLDIEPVALDSVARTCWETVGTAEGSLVVETDGSVRADRRRLQQLLENLLGNAVEHGSASPRSHAPESGDELNPDGRADGQSGARSIRGDGLTWGDPAGPGVTVRIGTLDDGPGFFVADDGPGVPEERRDEVFASGYSTDPEGTGFGLSIVDQIAQAHGWSVAVTESESGGARFEITDVDVAD
ncbi:response regulator [Halosimplex sp. TS25]|uniref:hybrid sensor histidine kinase/response regulator n=1 Tax=Halosimplex rarum TaxID=3396619 RepID=UPI0039ECBBAD